MNYRAIRYILFRVLEMLGALYLLPTAVSLIYGERSTVMFLSLAVFFFAIGYAGTRNRPTPLVFYAREGFVVTALAWIVISAFGAVPFVLSGAIPDYLDALFETVSGFTTTGASILSNVEHMEKGVMFWRCFTHWVGGMGFLVFMLAVLPLSEGYSMHLMRAESPGPSVGKFVPRVRQTAEILYAIYLGITLTEIICLMISGLTLYEASTLTFSTVGTGGFSITNAGINPYPVASQMIITFFMALCGINFSVFYFFIIKRPDEAVKSDEAKWYLVTMLVSAVLIAINVYAAGLGTTPGETLHHSLFTVASVMTTTGFATWDFNLWPEFSRTLLFCLMLVGACAGSTGGGFKFSRLVILVRNIRNELGFVVHPKSIKRVYMDGAVVERTTVKSVTAYLSIYVCVYIVSFIILSLDKFDFTTNMTAVAATLNNIGPGLNVVGATGNYGGFSAVSKIVLIFDMLAGRLELMPMLILLRRSTWKK